MLKAITCLAIFVLAGTVIQAQDYRAVYPKRTCIFIDEYYTHSWTVSIDSAVFINGDSVLYPCRNLREINGKFTPKGPSWIGDQIIVKPDGNTVFVNYSGDSVLLKTQARINETWDLFSNSYIHFTAEITKIDTMSYLGLSDSVKFIKLRLTDVNHNPMDHPLNNNFLLLSKNFGLIRTLNFYFVPDYYDNITNEETKTLNLAGLTNPEVGLQNFTWLEVYDFQPGDELHVVSNSNQEGTPDRPASFRYEKTIKKYLSRTDSENSVHYQVEITSSEEGSNNNEFFANYSCDTIGEYYESNPEFDKYPGIPAAINFGYILNLSTGKKNLNGCTGIYYIDKDLNWHPLIIDHCCYDDYLKGLGGPYSSCSGGYVPAESKTELVYYKKGTTEWGTPLTITAVEETPGNDWIEVFPNPAGNVVYIKVNDSRVSIYKISVMNLQGQVVYTNDHYSDRSPVNVKGLSGTNIVRITTPEGVVMRKIVVE